MMDNDMTLLDDLSKYCPSSLMDRVNAALAELARLRTATTDSPYLTDAYFCGLEDGKRYAADSLRAFRNLAERWQEIAKSHGVRQFTGNAHLLFANELLAVIDGQAE